MCLELFGSKAAVHIYQEFKRQHIAALGHGGNVEAQQGPFTVLLDVSDYAKKTKLHGFMPEE